MRPVARGRQRAPVRRGGGQVRRGHGLPRLAQAAAGERAARDTTIRGPHVYASGLTFDVAKDRTRPDQDFFPQSEIVTFFDNEEYNKRIGITPYSKEIQRYADECAALQADLDKESNHYERGGSKPVHEPKVHRWCEGVPL